MPPVFLAVRADLNAHPDLCRIEGCAQHPTKRGLCPKHIHLARWCNRYEELAAPSKAHAPRRPGPQPRPMPAPVAVEPRPPIVVELRPTLEDIESAKGFDCACLEISELISGGEVSVEDLPRAIAAILEQRDEARAKLVTYDQGAREAHRMIGAVTEQRDHLLAERQRICEALGHPDHPEPAGVARVLRADLDTARAQELRLLRQESEIAKAFEAFDPEVDLVVVARLHRKGILELTTAQHQACEALGGIPQGDVVELAKKAMAEKAEALFELTLRQEERRAIAQALQVSEEADLTLAAESLRRELDGTAQAMLELAELGDQARTIVQVCAEAVPGGHTALAGVKLVLHELRRLQALPLLTREGLSRRLQAYDTEVVFLYDVPEELREEAENMLRAHFRGIVWEGLPTKDEASNG